MTTYGEESGLDQEEIKMALNNDSLNRKTTVVKCATSDGFFCEYCYHAKTHEESPDCRWRFEPIKPERRRICNCLNGYSVCKEQQQEGKEGE